MAAREYLSNPLLADFGVKLGSRNIGVRKDRLDGSEVRAVIDVRIILPTDTRVSICESRGHGPADSVRPDHRDNHGIRNNRRSIPSSPACGPASPTAPVSALRSPIPRPVAAETPRSPRPYPVAQSSAWLRSLPASCHRCPPSSPSAALSPPVTPVPTGISLDAFPPRSAAACAKDAPSPPRRSAHTAPLQTRRTHAPPAVGSTAGRTDVPPSAAIACGQSKTLPALAAAPLFVPSPCTQFTNLRSGLRKKLHERIQTFTTDC